MWGMREQPVEEHLRDTAKALGGIAIKLVPLNYVGIPDRIVLLPGARVIFVELKRPKGGVVSKAQSVWHKRLRDWGFDVFVLNTKERIDECFEQYTSGDAVGDREG